MIGIIVALLVFLLVAYRFLRRVGQEARRQRTLTWPRATAVLEPGTAALEPAATNKYGEVLFYRAQLQEPYAFYARGEKFTGQRLAPELERLNPEETKLLLRALQKHERYQVCYDPHDPENNYLSVGRHLLSNHSLLLYAFFGLIFPLLVGYFGYWAAQASLQAELMVTGAFLAGAIIFLAAYYASKSVLNVGTYLIPTPTPPVENEAPPHDELLESLQERVAAPATPQKLSRS